MYHFVAHIVAVRFCRRIISTKLFLYCDCTKWCCVAGFSWNSSWSAIRTVSKTPETLAICDVFKYVYICTQYWLTVDSVVVLLGDYRSKQLMSFLFFVCFHDDISTVTLIRIQVTVNSALCAALHFQGRREKFFLSFFLGGGIKLLNSRSDVIFAP